MGAARAAMHARKARGACSCICLRHACSAAQRSALPLPAGPLCRPQDFVAPPGEAPPLLVKIHGGPTSQAGTAFSLPIQYWTSRGERGGACCQPEAVQRSAQATAGMADVRLLSSPRGLHQASSQRRSMCPLRALVQALPWPTSTTGAAPATGAPTASGAPAAAAAAPCGLPATRLLMRPT